MYSEETYIFNPNDIHTIATIAEEVGADRASTRQWVLRNLEALPEPMFSVPMSSKNSVLVWHGEDGRKIISHYRNQRTRRGL